MGAGWFLDLFYVYAFKAALHLKKAWNSSKWPLSQGTVERTSVSGGLFGCPTAEVVYTYEVNGSIFNGLDEKPFILRTSAEEYADTFKAHNSIRVRVKPQAPEVSVVKQQDQNSPDISGS